MCPEQVAQWYLRLNGFFTIANFVLHPSRREPQRTDADIVGIRFPYRREFPEEPAGDDQQLTKVAGKPYLAIAEVKRGRCNLNGPWTKRERKNVDAVLRDLGPFSKGDIPEVAAALHKHGVYDHRCLYCALLCIGDEANEELQAKLPDVP